MSTPQEIMAGPYARLYERFGDPTESLHLSYDDWLPEMADRPDSRLVPFGFDPTRPEHWVYVPKVEVQADHEWAPDFAYYNGYKAKLMKSLGAIPTLSLLHQMDHKKASEDDPTFLPERLRYNQMVGKNTIVITSHINFQEFGYVIGLRHIAKRDRDLIKQKGAVINKLMTRQLYKGKTLVEHFRPAGHVYFSSPKSKSAERHKVPEDAASLVNALFRTALRSDLAAGGMEIDIALTGSEVKPIRKDGDKKGKIDHLLIPQIDPASSKLLKDFDEAIAITLVGPPLADSWQMAISDVYDLNELLKTDTPAEVTDKIYGGIRHSIEEFTRYDVVYNKVGVPLGRIATSS